MARGASPIRRHQPVYTDWFDDNPCGFNLIFEKALGIMSLGENIPASVSELAKLSDEMWFLAGDGSYDTNWYTKRVMLSGVYASTGEPTIT